MAHQINDPCLPCGACLPECPFEAISPGEERYRIDPDRCADCGCCAATCALDAIAPAPADAASTFHA